ncbi:mitochondrial carrier like protein 2 [Ditylenchus destructor]|nr:mitochondrial carrier like protein 2 [Ditylenchus destructor]
MSVSGDSVRSLDDLKKGEREQIRDFINSLGFRTVISVVFHPITCATTLMKLGHEPYPAVRGRSFYYFGRETTYLPNVFSYIRNIIRDHGWKSIYSGLDAHLAAFTISSSSFFFVMMYMNRYCQHVGGEPVNLNKDESQLTLHESVRLRTRRAIRETIATLIATAVSRPFTVIMVRQIHSIIGNTTKYEDIFSSIAFIYNHQGMDGFFVGLTPDCIASFAGILGTAILRFLAERFIESNFNCDEDYASARCGFCYLIPSIVNSITYPLTVVSTVMALNERLPLTHFPRTSHWTDLYYHLKTANLLNIGGMFWRKEINRKKPEMEAIEFINSEYK